jgi:hypothetical protein
MATLTPSIALHPERRLGSSRALRTGYWTATIIFSLAMLMDGIAGIMLEETGQQVMAQLGYPVYIMLILGIAKVAGVIAILQTRYRTIKEWAFAGFTFNFLGAAASWLLIGKGLEMIIAPFVALAFMFVCYYLWKRTA